MPVAEEADMTVKDTFEAMSGRFRPERAQGLKAVIQYDITGPGGCTYHVDIGEGQCAIREGGAPQPNLTLTMSAQDWLDMLGGKLSGQVAFMSGKLKHKGDMSLLMRLPGLFGI
jgi:putative sterol carrier protein